MNDRKEINEIKEAMKSLVDRLEKVADDKKEFELTYPRDKEMIYLADCEVTSVLYDAIDKADKRIFEHGLYFNTKQEAEQHLKERKLLFKIHQWAKEQNEGWEPDWESIFQEKYYIFYDYYRKELCTSFNNSTGAINKLPYFKTRKIAQECIKLFGNEIIEVLC